MHSCGVPWWMSYFPSCPLIPSLYFQAFLDPHKKENSEANMSLLCPSLGLCRVPLFWILLSGVPHIFCLNSPVFLLPQGLLCQIPSWYFHLFRSSLCLSLIKYTRMLNRFLCLNISGDEASKWSNSCCPSKVSFPDLYYDRSIVNDNSLPIATTDWAISVLCNGPALQAHIAKNTPCKHWWSLPFSTEFVLCNLFKYLWNPSFMISLWFPLATACTEISKFYWKLFLNIPEKNHLHPQQSFLESQMEPRSFQNPIVRPGMV